MLALKLTLGVAATILTVVGYIPYFRDIFRRKTAPHLYTWLIWIFTQGTATFAVWYGGGKFGALGWVAGFLLVVAIFILSLKYGTKNIRTIDTVALVFALLAIAVWWQLNNPLLAVIMVSVIDGLGYIPTWRKSFEEPWSETPLFWATMAIACVLTIAADAQYNLLTVLYPTVLLFSNAAVWAICILRRRKISMP